MRFHDKGTFYSVSVSAREIRDFASRWPCSGMRGATLGMWFQFDKSNGDLVDMGGRPRSQYDDGAILVLSEDAQEFARPFLSCTNCDGPLPTTHGCVDRSGKHKFCDACGGIAEALAIGARSPVFLYESADGAVTCWTGGIVGHVVRKTVPERWRRFAPVRFSVRMLDGSSWYGTGPTSNGNYIRLRPMKGA